MVENEPSLRTTHNVLDFADRRGLSVSNHTDEQGVNLLFITELHDQLPDSVIQKYLSVKVDLPDTTSEGNCYEIAREAYNRNAVSGCLRSRVDTDDYTYGQRRVDLLLGMPHHAVNYEQLKSGGYLSVDFTCGDYIGGESSFDILVLGASSLKELAEVLEELYGGEWIDYDPNAKDQLYDHAPYCGPTYIRMNFQREGYVIDEDGGQFIIDEYRIKRKMTPEEWVLFEGKIYQEMDNHKGWQKEEFGRVHLGYLWALREG